MTIKGYHVNGWVFVSVFFVVTNFVILITGTSHLAIINWAALALNLFNLCFFWDDWVYKEHVHEVS